MQPHISYALAGSARLARFLQEAEQTCLRAQPELFWQMRESFDAILEPSIWQEVYLQAIQGMLDRPDYDGGRDWHANGMALYESDEFLLSLRSNADNGVGPPREGTARDELISTRSAPAMLAVLSTSPETFSFYRLPVDFEQDVFNPHHRITHDRDETVASWQRVDIRAPAETVEVVPRSGPPWCLMEFSLKPVFMQRWEFHKHSGAPVGATLSNNESARLVAMLGELARIGRKDARRQILALLEHRDFNVRWAAAKCLGKCSPQDLRWVLGRLCSDPHPLVCSLAAKTLAALGEPARSEGT
jgi:hypothetical protein